MINFIKEYLAKPAERKELMKLTLDAISLVRQQSVFLSLCPDNTGSHWLGIKNAAIGLFSQYNVALPQYYSNSKFSEEQLEYVGNFIATQNFEVIVFHGFPPYFKVLFKAIRNADAKVRIMLLFAGPASEYNMEHHQKTLTEAVALCKAGVVSKIGFNKKGLARAISNIYDVNCGHYMVKTSVSDMPAIAKENPTGIKKIGVLGSDTFNKNIHTQVVAALQVPEAQVYVFDSKRFDYLQSDRIIGVEGNLNHNDFLKLLSSMDVNYYLCFSESWGLVVTESLSVGVPCLTTASSGIFDYDIHLEQTLVVRDYDDVTAIAAQTLKLLPNYSSLSMAGIDYVHKLNHQADDLMQKFLER